MKKYLLQENGSFYKTNLHCHTTFSDGRLSPLEVKELYKSLGYSAVAFTDHDILIPQNELCDEDFIALNGFEVEINEPNWKSKYTVKACHICFVALDPENITQPFWSEKYLFGNAKANASLVKKDESEPEYIRYYTGEAISKMMQEGREKGFYVTYNHPAWSMEPYTTYMSYDGMHAFEMYNGSCLTDGYEDYNPKVYTDMLMGGKRLFCIGGDDNHNIHPNTTRKGDSGVAWTMIKADKLDYKSLTKSLTDGQFYCSCGPEIHELTFEDGKISVKCSEADRVVCNYGIRRAETVANDDYSAVTEAEFSFKPDDNYFRITVFGKDGKTASTNAYFADEIFAN